MLAVDCLDSPCRWDFDCGSAAAGKYMFDKLNGLLEKNAPENTRLPERAGDRFSPTREWPSSVFTSDCNRNDGPRGCVFSSVKRGCTGWNHLEQSETGYTVRVAMSTCLSQSLLVKLSSDGSRGGRRMPEAASEVRAIIIVSEQRSERDGMSDFGLPWTLAYQALMT